MPHRIPDPRRQLPFVQEPGSFTLEEGGGIERHRQTDVIGVVNGHCARGEPAPGPSLTGGSGSLDDHRRGHLQGEFHFSVGHTGQVAGRGQESGHTHSPIQPTLRAEC